jgi:hypothetical protein
MGGASEHIINLELRKIRAIVTNCGKNNYFLCLSEYLYSNLSVWKRWRDGESRVRVRGG